MSSTQTPQFCDLERILKSWHDGCQKTQEELKGLKEQLENEKARRLQAEQRVEQLAAELEQSKKRERSPGAAEDEPVEKRRSITEEGQ